MQVIRPAATIIFANLFVSTALAADKSTDMIASWNQGLAHHIRARAKEVLASVVDFLPTAGQAIEKARETGVGLSSVTVPLDGSDLAERILPLAEELAQQLSLEVQLLRVISMGSMAYYAAEGVTMDTSPVEEELEEEANQYLNRIAHEVSQRGITSVWFNVTRGSPALTIYR